MEIKSQTEQKFLKSDQVLNNLLNDPNPRKLSEDKDDTSRFQKHEVGLAKYDEGLNK
jgi:hypothetical protein